ncbi:MAG: hypothetical protein OXH78_02885 [Acidimicrobiaceae bacterium]|nr:hypothetical protein [Acidimicrobiaceae bacterium]
MPTTEDATPFQALMCDAGAHTWQLDTQDDDHSMTGLGRTVLTSCCGLRMWLSVIDRAAIERSEKTADDVYVESPLTARDSQGRFYRHKGFKGASV